MWLLQGNSTKTASKLWLEEVLLISIQILCTCTGEVVIFFIYQLEIEILNAGVYGHHDVEPTENYFKLQMNWSCRSFKKVCSDVNSL